ncbi:hypothetical protein [Paludibacterium denitrificans]|uniref:hypothetical protein n=1 Tax=Paludibacterium denitrificans TaxID=2675226 RepID=UPI001E369A16|nr:hypothetical protein [Paludibacterium denitrificans]
MPVLQHAARNEVFQTHDTADDFSRRGIKVWAHVTPKGNDAVYLVRLFLHAVWCPC